MVEDGDGGPGVQSSSGAASLQKVSAPVHPGETDFGGVLLEFSAGAQFVFPGAEKEFGGALESSVAENDLNGAQIGGIGFGPSGPDARRAGSFGHDVDGGVRHPTRVAQRARSVRVMTDGLGHRHGRHDVLDTTLGRAAGHWTPCDARPFGEARGQRAEAGSLDSFDDAVSLLSY